jgi:hypothetical protein
MSKKGGAGKKSRQKAIRRLLQLIAINEQKLADYPYAPAVPHWQHEIRVWRDQIEEQERRIRRG